MTTHPMPLVTVCSFDGDLPKIAAMQKVSRDHFSDMGVSLAPALVGTPEWWRAANDGTLVRGVVSGTISSVYWGSMNDWPMFDLVAADGSRSEWTREGDISRYVEGLHARLTFVLHLW